MRNLVEDTVKYRELLTAIDVPLITKYIPLSTIREVIQGCDAQEKRLRRLPAWLMMLLCILRGIFAKEAFSSVFARLCFVPCLKMDWDLSSLPDKSALCLARYRLGVSPLVSLFRRICRPLATPITPGAYVFGHRLVAIDTTHEMIADTEHNAHYFGRHTTKEGRRDAAFPLCQAIYLCECSTHVIFDAAIMPFKTNHHHYCKRLLRSVQADMLVMLDRGLLEFETLQNIVKKGAQFIIPAKAGMKLRPLKYFYDGSYLAELRYWKRGYSPVEPRLIVRVIPYTLDDPIRNPEGITYRMITSLLAPTLCPAKKVVETYHQRWDVEVTIDEIDTHQRLTWTPFRSQKPVGVIQEFYALLLAYFVICCMRFDSAEQLKLSPQRLSFVNGLRLIQHLLPVTQLIGLSYQRQLQHMIHQWYLYFRLPPRDNRINPRAVRRKRNKFRRKRPEEKSVKVPAFASVLRIVQRA